jgi:hypothetical protein
LSDSSWIREICRITNQNRVLEKNDSESTKTKVSLYIAEKGTIKGPRSQIVEMTLGSGKEGAGAEQVRHHNKISQKFKQLPRFLE